MSKRPPRGRLGRVVRLGGLTSRVSSSYLGQRIAGAFQDPERRERALRRLHLQNAERMVETMGTLKGAAMKLGQSLSMIADGLDLPEDVAHILARLNDRAPPVPFETIRASIEASLEAPLDALFARFDPEPLGTASLAQAHAAWLPDGRAVVVKVLHDGIEATVDADLAALRAMFLTGRVLRRDRSEMEAILDELRDRLHEELDYYREAAHIAFFHRAFAEVEGVTVPSTVPALCSDRVLTMDRVPGRPLRDFLGTASEEARQRAGVLLVSTFYDMLFRVRALHADPHTGNYLFTRDGGLGIVDFGCVKRFDPWFIGDYARLGLAVLDGDRAEAMRVCRRMGILASEDPASEAVLWRFARTITEPLRVAEYACGAPDDDVLERLRRQVPDVLAHPDIRSPAELVFLHRTLGGVFGILRRLRHRYGYASLFRERAEHAVAVADGRIPDTAPDFPEAI